MQKKDLEKAKLPEAPGVYFFLGRPEQSESGKDKREILYIGKATSLRDRVRSYFGPDVIKTRGPHIVDMVFKAEKVDFEETGSVLEAVIVEANLIKKHKPYYNTKEKDDKSFNCVAITKEEFPRVIIVRQKDIDTRSKTITSVKQNITNAAYDVFFGPYPSSTTLKEVLSIIRKIFPFRDRASTQKDRAVFYRQIGLAPDIETSVGIAEYKKSISHIKLLLGGNMKKLIATLTKEMHTAAKHEHFEEAETLKRKIFSLQHIQDVSLIKREGSFESNGFRIEAYDVAHISGSSMVGVMVVVDGEQSKKSEYKKFNIKGFTTSNDTGALKEILTRRFTHPEWMYPNVVLVDGGIAQQNAAREVFKDLKLDIPIIGVVKDERHRPKAIVGDKTLIEKHKYALLLANSEAHRFAITFHRQKRAKALLK